MRTYNEPWTKEDDNKLNKLYPFKTNKALSQIFDRTISGIKNRARKFRLKKDYSISGRKMWAKEEIEQLKQLYPHHETPQLTKIFNCTDRAIYAKAAVYNLHKTPDCLQKSQDRINKNLVKAGKVYRFKPGIIPHNKGKKMSPELYKKSKHTFFKKGDAPHNTKEDGYISIRNSRKRPYKWIRLAKNKWELYHRVVWENHHGEIPQGYNIVFKDGNSLNCNIDNLEMISNEKNMSRNTIHNYPPELKETLRLQSKINKIIEQRES